MVDSDQFAPSDEFVLHCDVTGCPLELSLVFGVHRELHGWGRMTWYDEGGAQDYDLCSMHTMGIKKILDGLNDSC